MKKNSIWKFLSLICHNSTRLWPLKFYLRIIFRAHIGYLISFRKPKTFNEKMNWLKVYYRKPILSDYADKYEVKKIVASIIGDEYVVPNYGVYNSWDEIDFAALPNQFVIKCTHDSGGAFICKDKSSFNYNQVKKAINNNLKRNFYYWYREWPYKNITPRIIVDKLLDDHTGKELRDYKFWCFNGKPTYMYCTIKGDNVFENFYDMDFKPVPVNHGFPRHQPEFEKPLEFELMKKLAAKLSADLPFVRVDFFDVDGHVYFGEFTFYDWGGMRPFNTIEMDREIGDKVKLPEQVYC